MSKYMYFCGHNTMDSKPFIDWVEEYGGEIEEEETEEKDWTIVFGKIPLNVTTDEKALQEGLKLFKELNSLFDEELFTIAGTNGFLYTEENLETNIWETEI